jgi:quercetin dioxygenase-like cupin family protein
MQPRVSPSHGRNGAGPALSFTQTTILLGTADTGGEFALVHLHCVRGDEPPLRRHHREDLVVHVLDGELAFRIDQATHHLGAGATIQVSRGSEHGYALHSATADLLILLTPAGAETSLADLHASDSVERMVTIAAHHGIEITGPPPDLA